MSTDKSAPAPGAERLNYKDMVLRVLHSTSTISLAIALAALPLTGAQAQDGPAIAQADLLVTYSSQLAVSEKASTTLRRWLEKGGRWFAMHSSSSLAGNTAMAQILGCQFVDHPPYHEFKVQVMKPEDPLLAGISDFSVFSGFLCAAAGDPADEDAGQRLRHHPPSNNSSGLL